MKALTVFDLLDPFYNLDTRYKIMINYDILGETHEKELTDFERWMSAEVDQWRIATEDGKPVVWVRIKPGTEELFYKYR